MTHYILYTSYRYILKHWNKVTNYIIKGIKVLLCIHMHTSNLFNLLYYGVTASEFICYNSMYFVQIPQCSS